MQQENVDLRFLYSTKQPRFRQGFRLFRKFGFPFDHVYAYEITPTPPEVVFDALPQELIPAFHWINVGVEQEIGHRRNPFTHILSQFNEDGNLELPLFCPSLTKTT